MNSPVGLPAVIGSLSTNGRSPRKTSVHCGETLIFTSDRSTALSVVTVRIVSGTLPLPGGLKDVTKLNEIFRPGSKSWPLFSTAAPLLFVLFCESDGPCWASA